MNDHVEAPLVLVDGLEPPDVIVGVGDEVHREFGGAGPDGAQNEKSKC